MMSTSTKPITREYALMMRTLRAFSLSGMIDRAAVRAYFRRRGYVL